MQFFCDECCPRSVAVALAQMDHDVLHVLNVTRGASDLLQARHAFADNRILVSSDYDFSELAVRRGMPFTGLVLMAPHRGGLAAHAETLSARIDQVGDDLLGYLTILQEKRTRRRRLEQ